MRTLYECFAGTSLFAAASQRARSADIQGGHYSVLGVLKYHLGYCQPGTNTRASMDGKFPFIVGGRADSPRFARLVPTFPPPAGMNYRLAVAQSMSAESLQRSYGVYGVDGWFRVVRHNQWPVKNRRWHGLPSLAHWA